MTLVARSLCFSYCKMGAVDKKDIVPPGMPHVVTQSRHSSTCQRQNLSPDTRQHIDTSSREAPEKTVLSDAGRRLRRVVV